MGEEKNKKEEIEKEDVVDNDVELETKENKEEDKNAKEIDYKGIAMRALADLDNYKRRTEEENGEFKKMVVFNVVSEFLDIYNNLKQAENFIPEDQKSIGWVKGISMITSQFKERLASLGLEEFNAEGKIFDHNTMEAISVDKDETKENDVVLKEISSGFKMGDKVVQHARVIVNKK